MWGKFVKLIILSPCTILFSISGGGSNSASGSVSKPLTSEERANLYNSSVASINNTMGQSGQNYNNGTSSGATFAPDGPVVGQDTNGHDVTSRGGDRASQVAFNGGGLNMPTYNTPTYQQPGQAQQLTNGDYAALQKQMTDGYTAPLDYQKAKDQANVNSDLAKRGLWSSGLAEKAIGDNNAVYAPQYAQAGANATNAATQAQLTQNQNVNAYNTQNAQNANNFNTTQATNQNAADWAPLQYLQKLWENTAGQGTISDQRSYGWNLGAGAGGMGGGGEVK